MKPIKSSVLVTSENRNRYLYDKNHKLMSICHPLFFRLIEMEQQGENLWTWLAKTEGRSVDMEGIGSFSSDDILYYLKKYVFFKESGFFSEKDPQPMKKSKLLPQDIDIHIANATEIVFEVTQKCNLKCTYCAYGKFYDSSGSRTLRDLDMGIAKRALDLFLSKEKSTLNRSHGNELSVGFYGGEPLINFPLIDEIVDYLRRPDLIDNPIAFVMTTNGLLLEKYMDFLVKHQFRLLISLDGNEKNNEYRIFENGKPAYKEIVRNVKTLKKKHPVFFEKNVNFNVVVHDRNSLPEIYRFFKEEFAKIPELSPLSPLGIKNEMKDEFKRIYKSIYEELKGCQDSANMEKEMLVRLPHLMDLYNFICYQQFFMFVNYRHLSSGKENLVEFPTGTCHPFSKKIFVTVDGMIFPCERIGQLHTLGTVTLDAVLLDTKSIADSYNLWYERIKEQCLSCYHAGVCMVCMYYIDSFPKLKQCNWRCGYDGFSSLISKNVSILENRPQLYERIMQLY